MSSISLDSDHQSAPVSAPTKRACDNCRTRKVKCDSALPQCSNCRISDFACAYNKVVQKRGPRFRKTPHRVQEKQRSHSSPDTTFQTAGSKTVADDSQVTSLRSLSSQRVLPPSPASWRGDTGAPLRNSQSSIAVNSSLSPNWQTGGPSRIDTLSTPISHINSVPQRQTMQGNHILDMGKSINLLDVQQNLIMSLQSVLPGVAIESLASRCIDLFTKYLFPIMPIIHESTLRHTLSLLQPNIVFDESLESPSRLAVHRCFALLTAVCAAVSFILPSRIFEEGPVIGNMILQASRKVLNLCHDLDLESPDSSSVIIRYLHSNCTHALGQTRVSWHLLGESIRLAQEMYLFDEHTLDGVDPVESQLLRNIFWQLYTADKSSALLNNRPFTMHEFNLRTRISVSMESRFGHSLLDRSKAQNQPPFEDQIMTSFCLCQKMWSIASDLILDLQLLHPISNRDHTSDLSPSNEQRATIMDTYLRFLDVIDDLPLWLSDSYRDERIANDSHIYQQNVFSIQRTNLTITFHSLSLMIIQKFFQLGLSSLVGVSSEPLMMSLKKADIARDMLAALHRASFESLQINGESCILANRTKVEKIRQVGAALLEISQKSNNDRLSLRAQSTFSALLEILINLDSKASDSLT